MIPNFPQIQNQKNVKLQEPFKKRFSVPRSVRYTKVPEDDKNHNIHFNSLSTCPHCTNVKKYLKQRDLEFEFIDVDMATRAEKREFTLFLKQNTLSITFPVITIDDKIITGFNKRKINAILGKQS
jgi:glutaredoxin